MLLIDEQFPCRPPWAEDYTNCEFHSPGASVEMRLGDEYRSMSYQILVLDTGPDMEAVPEIVPMAGRGFPVSVRCRTGRLRSDWRSGA